MTVSGTVSQTTYDTGQVIEAAFRRCKIPGPMITGEYLQIARDALYVMLSALSQKGLQLWTVEQITYSSWVAGTTDITLQTGTIDVGNVLLRNLANSTDIPLVRISQDDYVLTPNKSFQGRPLMFWFDRQRDAPVMHIWPAADSATVSGYELVIYRQRHIMDVGNLTQTLDVPQRWLDAVIAGLASRLSMEIKEVDASLMAPLKQMADEALQLAQTEDRDSADLTLLPDLSSYTR